eukprot:CAMPEP_0197053140 /NCGR_PEP_ID=MMETSP1384-20130603/27476_1 /TAXON_ID=29189 /ORGANISM="Ammonia sp." /LENGTH=426 /DNA_ID=CAMNT_0042485989 /DNA_START=28 /DNA_END=1308 /DNA_ORIENTATION=+
MNAWLRINKVLYLVVLFGNANRSIAAYVAKKNIYFLTARIFRITVLTICVLHWMACIWLQFANFEKSDDKTWLSEMGQKKRNISGWSQAPGYAYLLSLYFVIITMTTTGYGDITPVTRSEIMMTNFLIIAGDTLMALMAGAFIQYISNINQASLNITIKEKSVTHYLNHRREEILKQSKAISETPKLSVKFAIDEKVRANQEKKFKKLIKRVNRYFQMQLDFQYRVSTLDSLTQHLPLYYRMKLLHSLFHSIFKEYPYLYNDKNLYFRILDNIQEQIFTYWAKDNSFEFIVDFQQRKIQDFMIIEFGYAEVFSRKQWKQYTTATDKKNAIKPKILSSGALIGFRSLILQNSVNTDEKAKRRMEKKEKPKYVIRPIPTDKGEPFKMVSILKIPEVAWKQILNDAMPDYEERLKFEKYVEEKIKHHIE